MRLFHAGRLLITAGAAIMVLAGPAKNVHGAEKPGRGTAQLTVTAIPRGNTAGSRTFSVVLLCDTDAARANGLQGHKPLGRGEAALFIFDPPRAVTFWMGKVDFPIDIQFVDPEGNVAEVASDVRPGSRSFYGSGVPVKWVVETAAGAGIVVGDRVKIGHWIDPGSRVRPRPAARARFP
jgi:uncharacterized protein